MVLLGLMGGAKTETPLDLSQILFKRLRVEGECYLNLRVNEIRGRLTRLREEFSRYDVEIEIYRVSRQTVTRFLKGSTRKGVCESKGRRRIRSGHPQGEFFHVSLLFRKSGVIYHSFRRSMIGRISKTLTPRWNKPRTSARSFVSSMLEKNAIRKERRSYTTIYLNRQRESAMVCIETDQIEQWPEGILA